MTPRTASALFVLVLVLSSCVQTTRFNHEPAMAVAQAQKFANTAFVEHDLSSAYDLLSPNMKAQFSSEQFKDSIAKMHPSQYPSSIEVTDYEPVPGQKGMNIFVSGVAGKERFYYRFFMEGTKETNYAVAGLWRGSGPYPPSNLRKPLK